MTEFPEKWISAFLTGAKVREICQEAGISKTKFYALRRDPDFQAVLRERKDMAISAGLEALRGHFLRDIGILQAIAEDPGIAPQVRINAVSVSLQQLSNWISTVDLAERVTALENARNDGFETIQGVS